MNLHAARHRGRRAVDGHAERRRRDAAPRRPDPDQPALRHQEGRRPADARRLLDHRRDLEQAARLRRARHPRAEARRPGRGRRARQRAVRGRRRPAAAPDADGLVRPAHHPAPADRHLLRPGRQDQRASSSPAARPRRATPRPSGSTTCAPARRPSARRGRCGSRTSPSSRPPSAPTRWARPRARTRARPAASGGSPARTSRARGDNLDIAWLRDEAEAEEGLTDPDDIAAAILGHLREAMREMEALVVEMEGEEPEEAPIVAAAE